MSEKKPPGIMLYAERAIMLRLLTDEQIGKVMRAVFDFYFDSVVPELDKNEQLCYELIEKDMQRNLAKYQKICERNKSNALKSRNKAKG